MHLAPSCLLRRAPRVLLSFLTGMFFLATVGFAIDDTAKKTFDVPAGDAARALKAFSEQSGRGVIYPSSGLKDVQTNAVKGEMTIGEALGQLTKDTPLVVTRDEKTGAYAVRKETERETKNAFSRPGKSSDRAANDAASDADKRDGVIKLETFEVMGSKLLNMDKPRSIDDPQPRVIFDRESIERSGATNVEEFLKTRLSMNSVAGTNGQSTTSSLGNTSSINLRGLGLGQTLILVDGRRAPTVFTAFNNLTQTDINGIPLSAIERIDVLPTAASGIYGGGAAGGVVNIVLRRSYSATEIAGTYDNTFGTDSAVARMDVSSGFTLEGGKTHVLLSASYSKQNSLELDDRAFPQSYQYRFLNNNAGNYQIFNIASTPPLGSTTNIRSTTGANLTLKTGELLNSPITYVPVGYRGTQSDNGAAFIQNAGKYNLEWGNSADTVFPGGRASLLTGGEVASLIATINRDFSPRVNAFLDTQFSQNTATTEASSLDTLLLSIPSSAPTNPFNQNIYVEAPLHPQEDPQRSSTRAMKLSTGATVKISETWMGELDYTWSRSSTSFSYPSNSPSTVPALGTGITNGTIDVLKDLTAFPLDYSFLASPVLSRTITPPVYSLSDISARTGGELVSLPGGPLSISALLEWRTEKISDGSVIQYPGPITTLTPARSQDVLSAYLEADLPLIGKGNPRSLARSLDFQLALRRDEYTTRGVTGALASNATVPLIRNTNRVHSTDPSLSLRYAPSPDIAIRISYGTGFVAPSVQQVAYAFVAGNGFTITDPARGNTSYVLSNSQFVASGGNPSLRPERLTNRSAGLILTPRFIPGFRVSIDYTQIRKKDAITSAPGLADLEQYFPDRVIRGPKLATDPADWKGPITFLDQSNINAARFEVDACDIQMSYQFDTERFGKYEFYSLATRTYHFQQQLLPSAPVVNFVGFTSGFPLTWKGSVGLNWKFGQWAAGWNAQYFNSYFVYSASDSAATIATKVRNQGGTRVSSQLAHDIFVTYRLGRSKAIPSFIRDTAVTLGVKNVLGEEPAFDASGATRRYYSRYLSPRLASYYITVRHSL